MGRPPCCDKVGIKKGPWTPEEDIILVSYIQEHGPGNWRSVPTNTGLLRCSKSCRLRWTNYLRPGIKRGNFTPHEEGMIIHLQALLGNKWAAIASYLPQRTDNDIKNYWNTHLKKKLKKLQSALDPNLSNSTTTTSHTCFDDRRNFDQNMVMSNHISNSSKIPLKHNNLNNSSSSLYASSTENISRLLEGWMRSSQKPDTSTLLKEAHHQPNNTSTEDQNKIIISTKAEEDQVVDDHVVSHEEFDHSSRLSFDHLNNSTATTTTKWDNKSSSDSMPDKGDSDASAHVEDDTDKVQIMQEMIRSTTKQRSEQNNTSTTPPLSFLEKWLLDESAGQVEEMMELSTMF